MASQLILSLRRQKNCYGSRISLLSPAKLNLYLNILGKLPSGYHRIESLVERVSLCDRIGITVTKTPDIRISCNDKKLAVCDNLCCRAARLVQEKFGLPWGFDIALTKKIPVGAGLGGGSSNAASVIIAINALLRLKMSQKVMFELGARLGSDVNFFLAQTQYAFIYGRGEKVVPFTGRFLRHWVIWPGVHLSTALVYSKYTSKLTNIFNNAKILRYAVTKGDTVLVKENLYNALEKSALSASSELKQAQEQLLAQGVFCRVTGSGSALYTIIDRAAPARVLRGLPKRWRAFAVHTF